MIVKVIQLRLNHFFSVKMARLAWKGSNT
jgi:hypothetical protein